MPLTGQVATRFSLCTDIESSPINQNAGWERRRSDKGPSVQLQGAYLGGGSYQPILAFLLYSYGVLLVKAALPFSHIPP